jgi:hypothetical protein
MIDTSMVLELLCGAVRTQRNSTDTDGWKAEYNKITNLLELLKIDWKKFFLTPYLITETFCHVNLNEHDQDFREIVEKVVEFVKSSGEEIHTKEDFIACIDTKQQNMRLEPGDLSIYAIADDFAKSKREIAIFTKDSGFTTRYHENKYVMVINYQVIPELSEV